MQRWQDRDAARSWDAGGAGELPTRAEQQQVLLDLLAAAGIGDGAVLDLGVGSGLVAEAVLDALPAARLVGVDSSSAMLDLARERLSRFGPRALLVDGDLSEPGAIALPDLPYRAAFSVQTLHHLTDGEQAEALAWTARTVEPGGLVVVVDRVRLEEPLFADWATVWRRVDPRTPETYAAHLAELAEAGDRPALLQDQLAWLQAAGLLATCLHLYGNRAVLVGRRPALTAPTRGGARSSPA